MPYDELKTGKTKTIEHTSIAHCFRLSFLCLCFLAMFPFFVIYSLTKSFVLIYLRLIDCCHCRYARPRRQFNRLVWVWHALINQIHIQILQYSTFPETLLPLSSLSFTLSLYIAIINYCC